MTFYVYGLFDPISKDLRYIGESYKPKDRLVKHLVPSKLKSPTHKNNWVKSLLKQKLKPALVILEEFSSEEEAFQAEIFYINYFKYLGCDLTNTAEGGLGGFTGTHSPETLEKISLANSKPKSEEHKNKIALSHMGISPSLETREKIRLTKIGDKTNLAKLNDAKVREIKKFLAEGLLQISQIAKMFGVSRGTIGYIKHNRRWTHVK